LPIIVSPHSIRRSVSSSGTRMDQGRIGIASPCPVELALATPGPDVARDVAAVTLVLRIAGGEQRAGDLPHPRVAAGRSPSSTCVRQLVGRHLLEDHAAPLAGVGGRVVDDGLDVVVLGDCPEAMVGRRLGCQWTGSCSREGKRSVGALPKKSWRRDRCRSAAARDILLPNDLQADPGPCPIRSSP
jgi:hypothetical protein